MAKVKLKTNRGAAKRFRKTGSGIKRRGAYRNHILTKKSQKRKRNQRHPSLVKKCDMLSVKRSLHGS